jgi:hypothetical protein
MGKILRKRLKRLETRRHDRDMTVTRIKNAPGGVGDPEKAFRKPGSMTK